jgi:hypothetical protein
LICGGQEKERKGRVEKYFFFLNFLNLRPKVCVSREQMQHSEIALNDSLGGGAKK